MKQLQEEMEKLRKKQQEAQKIPDPKDARRSCSGWRASRRSWTEDASRRPSSSPASARRGPARPPRRPADAMQRAAEKLNRGEDAQEEEQGSPRPACRRRRRKSRRPANRSRRSWSASSWPRWPTRFGRMKERQESLIAERERIQKLLLQLPENWRALLISLGDLSRNQGKEQGLAKDLAALAEKKLEVRPVFARLLKKTADTMDQASKKLKEHQELVRDQHDKPETEAVAEAARLQKEALDRLEGVLQTLKEEQNAPLAQRNDGGGRRRGRGGRRRGAGNGSEIPPLAQLKLLRQMQADVNKRTEDFRKAHPDPAKLDEKGKAELQDIRRSQQEIAELLDELIEPDDRGR